MSGCGQRDLVAGRWAFALWGAPAAAILVGVAFASLRTVLWVPAFFVMGTACLVNARGCGRLHCHVTGPVFLLAGIATAFDLLGGNLVLALAALGTLLGYSLEWVRGKYIDASQL